MIEQLRTVCAAMEDPAWSFSYGRRDFNNLKESAGEDDSTVYVFLDPIKRRKDRSSDTGNPTGWNIYEGKMMMVAKAKLDQSYDNQKNSGPDAGKWRANIKQFTDDDGYVDQLEDELTQGSTCGTYDWILERWDVTDVINLFDENFDGVLIDFRIKARE